MDAIDKIHFDDGMSIEMLDANNANTSEESRIDWVTSLAAVSRGKDKSNNPKKRYKSLLMESEGKKPSRPLEFLPIVLDGSIPLDKMGIKDPMKVFELMRFSYIDSRENIFTNMRALVNVGAIYEEIPYTILDGEFAAFRIKAPMFVWAQIVTHTQLSTESQSDRVVDETEYWLPGDIEERLNKLKDNDKYKDEIIQKVYLDRIELADDIESGNLPDTEDGFKSYMINAASQRDVQLLLKALGYKREIYSRAPYYFKMKEFVITGWVNDDFAWPHFLRERNAYAKDGGPKNWTQKETQKIAYAIRTLLERNYYISKNKILGEKRNEQFKKND